MSKSRPAIDRQNVTSLDYEAAPVPRALRTNWKAFFGFAGVLFAFLLLWGIASEVFLDWMDGSVTVKPKFMHQVVMAAWMSFFVPWINWYLRRTTRWVILVDGIEEWRGHQLDTHIELANVVSVRRRIFGIRVKGLKGRSIGLFGLVPSQVAETHAQVVENVLNHGGRV